MTQQLSGIFLFLLTLTLGLRHGIDWDHIAAIGDITNAAENKKQGIILGTFYILGHAAVIFILGFLSVVLGVTLPGWVDSAMERVIGVTLLLLGFWLLSSIIIHGHNFKMKSSRIFILEQSIKLYNFIHSLIPHTHSHKHKEELIQNIDKRAAFFVGTIHGIGAETPTQVLLFVSAAGVGRGLVGILLVFTFVFGLVVSNFVITLLSIKGLAIVKDNSLLRLCLGTATAVFSLIVGALFLLNKGNILPAILGG